MEVHEGAQQLLHDQRGLALGRCASDAPISYNDANLDNPNGAGGCNGAPYTSYIIEFDADCNSDGIVDFGQIRDGTLADANHNYIPDCCEAGQSCAPCPGDIVEDHTVNGVDLAAVINAWGTNGGAIPRADTNHDGIVDGVDLANVLGSWGPCP